MKDPGARFRGAIGGATLVMLAISWPLWVGTDDFPRVPFFRGYPEIPPWLSRVSYATLIVTIGLGSIGFRSRKMLGIASGIFVVLILGDQHRFQPWAYQFLMVALAMATTSRARALGLARLFAIALYVHSGFSKCDESFYRWMGPSFLQAGLYRFGIEPRSWPPITLEIATRLMPTIEIAIGLGLSLKRTRKAALVGAVVMHLTLLWILGPFGLAQSGIVLIWNAAMILEALILFGSKATIEDVPAEESRFAPWTRLAFLLAAILPFGERAGLFDVWPSFALYASHPGRTRIIITANGADFPGSLREELGAKSATEPRALNLTNWSRRVRGTPIYPQNRATNGLAEAIAARYPEALVSVSQIGAAGSEEKRDSVELAGAGAIRDYGNTFWINAHPAPWRPIGTENASKRGAGR